MSNEVLIKVEGVSKKFCLNLKQSLIYGGTDIVKGFLGKERSSDLRKGEFWAVDDISFEVRRGECLGLIGHNGAGKSTLLKMLNGLIRPDKGQIEMNGKVGALIELGAGFSPLLTGRENIYNNGSVLGFSKEEIAAKFDEIVDFAELKDFIDSPVQNYSSGMKIRLGFAIAAQMSPDILLIDEVLAVGDMGYVLKCFNHMDKLLKNTAIILVSHSIPQVARMATRLVIMEKGQQKYNDSDIPNGINLYYSKFGTTVVDFERNDFADLMYVNIETENGEPKIYGNYVVIPAYEPIIIKIKIHAKILIEQPFIYIAFYDKEQRNFAEINNFNEYINYSISPNQEFEFVLQLPQLGFSQGIYSLTIGLWENKFNNRHAIFRYQSVCYFQVDNAYHGWAPIQLQSTWKLINSVNKD